MPVRDKTAYFVVNHKYHRSLGSGTVNSASTGDDVELQKQDWESNNVLEPVIVHVLEDLGHGKKKAHLKLFSLTLYLSATSAPYELEGVVDPQRFNPPQAYTSYMTWIIKPTEPFDSDVGDDVLHVRIQNNKTHNYLQATSASGKVVCRSQDTSDDDVIWKLVRVPNRLELERLWNDRADGDLLEGDKEGLTEEVRRANRMLRDMRGFIHDCSVNLTDNLRYLQAGQYQTFWPIYQNLEAHVRNFVQRGFRY
ncbi:hypothetical protein BJX96DRAFT_174052 [Aspergillus floccosus]